MIKKYTKILILVFAILPAFAQKDIDNQLLVAASENNETKIYDLLRKGANANAKTESGVTPLMYAVDNSNYFICSKLIEYGANIDEKPTYAPPALVTAVKNNDFEIAELLVLNGADLNIADYYKQPALIHAIYQENNEMTDMLLHYGANPDIFFYNENPILIASRDGDTTLLNVILKYKPNVNIKNERGYYPLKYAVSYNRSKVAEILIENGAKIEDELVEIAVKEGNSEVLKVLLANGADPNQKIDGYYAYDYCLAKGDRKSKKVLRKFKAKHSYAPILKYAQIGFTQNFSADDYMLGGKVGVQESRYNYDFFAGIVARPYSKKIRLQHSENLYYQIGERRNLAFVELDKNFNLFLLDREYTTWFGIFFGAKVIYSFGTYTATLREFQPEFFYAPKAGIYIKRNPLYIKLGYQYTDFKDFNYSPHRFELAFHLYF